jgi:hypothetical protein
MTDREIEALRRAFIQFNWQKRVDDGRRSVKFRYLDDDDFAALIEGFKRQALMMDFSEPEQRGATLTSVRAIVQAEKRLP